MEDRGVSARMLMLELEMMRGRGRGMLRGMGVMRVWGRGVMRGRERCRSGVPWRRQLQDPHSRRGAVRGLGVVRRREVLRVAVVLHEGALR